MLEEVDTSSGSRAILHPPMNNPDATLTLESESTKLPWMERARRRLARELHKLFFAEPGQPSDDHLVEVVRRDPEAACRLIKSVTLFSTLCNAAVALACFVFLRVYWGRCGSCSRPLRWWILLHAVMQMLQLPVRVVLLVYVRAAQVAGRSFEPCVVSLTGSPAWRLSKLLALAQYGWLVLGIVWWMHADSCAACPGVKKLTLMALLLSIVRACTALVAYDALFQNRTAEVLTVIAATDAQIDALQLFRFPALCNSSSLGASEGVLGARVGQEGELDEAESCSICLSDFADGVMIRRLPCGHEFHRRCVDCWLRRNKRCPLCVQAIDDKGVGAKRSL
eukprot:TRINITY_DN25792_c0_g1_i1.p1 TRINITY_DN25792_c0_g1~~TRINITY_DN25792_c0_g1_i1.p1  ORF type:complete len:337 (-),score=60.83 TRINITY_DN25792_c0_g1_i1:152-1162(-)